MYLSEISGPIILETYRVIADFTKTSKHELNLQTGDLLEIVEKSQNGEKNVYSKLSSHTSILITCKVNAFFTFYCVKKVWKHELNLVSLWFSDTYLPVIIF